MHRGGDSAPETFAGNETRLKALREIRKQTENLSTHWAELSAKGLAKVTDRRG